MNKIYETDSYRKETDTVITGCIDTGDGVYVSLADSIFFPEEGGQYADTGVILCKDLEFDILDGVIVTDSGDICPKSAKDDTCKSVGACNIKASLPAGIWYSVDYSESCKTSCKNLTEITDTLVISAEIHCILDFHKRFDRMQNHTGEHILTGTIHNDYGCNNIGFHLSDDGLVTLDLDMPLTYEEVISEEAKANAVIYENLPVTASFPTSDELKSINYRSKMEIDGQVRLVTIGDDDHTVDICACCAPHVSHTGEVGMIKVISVVNWKGGVRIGILCGRRALEYINHRQEIIKGLTDLMTTGEDNLINMTRNRMDEIISLKTRLAEVLEAGVVTRIMQGDKDIERTHTVFTDADFPTVSLKNIYNLLKSRYGGYVGVFSGDDANGYRYYAGSREVSSKTLIKTLSGLGAKGGGNDDMIQGRIEATRSQIEQLFSGIRPV